MATLDLDRLNELPAAVQALTERVERLTKLMDAMSARFPEPLVTYEQAAEQLNCSARHVQNLCDDEVLKRVHVGRCARVDLTPLRGLTDEEIHKIIAQRKARI
jgi:excisionase family DNA binding protein